MDGRAVGSGQTHAQVAETFGTTRQSVGVWVTRNSELPGRVYASEMGRR